VLPVLATNEDLLAPGQSLENLVELPAAHVYVALQVTQIVVDADGLFGSEHVVTGTRPPPDWTESLCEIGEHG
jgi:hypothetical protein